MLNSVLYHGIANILILSEWFSGMSEIVENEIAGSFYTGMTGLGEGTTTVLRGTAQRGFFELG
jgi:hypothetical protein